MKYNVFFHQGDELTLKTKVEKAEAWLDDIGLHVSGPTELLVRGEDLLETELFRLHGLGRVIRVDHSHGRLFLSVVRFMIGQFALINFFKTGELHKQLVAITRQQSASD